jgi:hypothetical protein
MIAQQVGSKATRDALFLSSFAPEDLPRVVIASAATAMVAVFAATHAFARFGPARVVPLAFASSSVLYAAEWALAPVAPRATAVALYLHTSIFGALAVSGFWSVVNERFDPHTAKRVVSRIGAGATFGGVAGGLLAERIGAWSEPTTMLAALAALNALAALGVRQVGSDGSVKPSTPGASAASGLEILRHAPYLRALAGLVLLTAISAGLLDYAFKAEAARSYAQDPHGLLSFFAVFHTATAILALLVQTGLGKAALTRLGVAGTVATLPGIVIVSAAAAAVVPRLAMVVVARGAELVLANSIFRSGYELLFTPVAPEKKRPTKALIDVAGNRLGDALGSVLTLAVLALLPEAAIAVVLALAALFALAGLWLSRRLHRGYVRELEDSLRSGASGDIDPFFQAATLQTLSTLGLDRDALFEQLAAQQTWREPAERASGPDDPEPERSSGSPIDAPAADPVHAAAHALRTGTASEVRAVLSADSLDERLIPQAVALLARRDVYHDAIAALRRVAEASVPVLAKSLLDRDQPFAVRRRIPRVLEVCNSTAAIDALASGLDDERFEVRYRCALALARILHRARDAEHESVPRIPSERVHQVVTRELEEGRRVWDSRRLLDEEEEDAPLVDRARHHDVHRSVEYVFTVLSLAYDPEPLRLSLVALAGDDRTLRGTALEYLETVLPESVRDALFPMLDVRVEIRQRRTQQEIVDELVRSMQAIDARALQAAIEKRSKP